MRWHIAKTIWFKELTEAVRDWRALFVMLLLPAVLYPGLLILGCQALGHWRVGLRAARATVIVSGCMPRELRARLGADASLAFVSGSVPSLPAGTGPSAPPPGSSRRRDDGRRGRESGPRCSPSSPHGHQDRGGADENESGLNAWARGELQGRRGDLLLVFPPDFALRLTHGETASLRVFHDDSSALSLAASRRVKDALSAFAWQLSAEARQVVADGLHQGAAGPLVVTEASVISPQERVRRLAARALPALLILTVLFGAFYPAVDLTAGEKERGTLRTLLTAPVSVAELVFGKFLAVSCLCLASAAANLISLVAAVTLVLRNTQAGGAVWGGLDGVTAAVMLVQLVPLALLFSAVMMAVSAFAASFKEAQNLLTPVYVLILVPVAAASLPGLALSPVLALVPVLNLSLLARDMLLQAWDPALAALVLLANGLYCYGAIQAAAAAFRSEAALFGTTGSVTAALRSRSHGAGAPTPLLALLVLGAAFVLNLYGGTALQRWDLCFGLLASQVLFIAAPALAAVWALKLDARQVLSLRRPAGTALLGALLLGLSSWAVLGPVAGWLQNLILPEPEAVSQLVRKALGLADRGIPLATMLLCLAAAPAVCEELLFRGLVLSALRSRLGKWEAILLTALLFGLLHLSLYRILPTALIGLVVTVIVWESGSILPGMLFHVLHNGLTLLAYRLGWLGGAGESLGGGMCGTAWLVALTALFLAGGALLFWRPTQARPAARRSAEVCRLREW